MYKICVTADVSDAVRAVLEPGEFELTREPAGCDALLTRGAGARWPVPGAAPLAVALAGAGCGDLPLDELSAAGVAAFNAPGANANAVKEMVLCAMLMAARNVIEGLDWARGHAPGARTDAADAPPMGTELMGKALGIIGLGASGARVARGAANLGMSVLGYDPFMDAAARDGLDTRVSIEPDLSFLERCDYVSLHVPGARGGVLMGAPELERMRRGAVLINFASGALVDAAAVRAALADGRLRRYMADWPCEGLLGLDGVVALPQLAQSTRESEENCAVMAARQLRDYLLYGNVRNSVNYPECVLTRSRNRRICIAHANVRGMISRCSAILSAHGLNIARMQNDSRGDNAYSIIELDAAALPGGFDEIARIEGVRRVRAL